MYRADHHKPFQNYDQLSEAPTTITISQKYSHKNENENEHCKNIIIILCGLSFCVQNNIVAIFQECFAL